MAAISGRDGTVLNESKPDVLLNIPQCTGYTYHKEFLGLQCQYHRGLRTGSCGNQLNKVNKIQSGRTFSGAPHVNKLLDYLPGIENPGCHPSLHCISTRHSPETTEEMGAGGSEIQGYPGLHNEYSSFILLL